MVIVRTIVFVVVAIMIIIGIMVRIVMPEMKKGMIMTVMTMKVVMTNSPAKAWKT